MSSGIIKVMKITYESLCKLLDLGFTVIVHNPQANVKQRPKKIPYEFPKRPSFIPVNVKQERLKRAYRKAFIKGQLK